MKKDTILILIAVAAILALVLPKPAGMIIPLIILIPVVIYLITAKTIPHKQITNITFDIIL